MIATQPSESIDVFIEFFRRITGGASLSGRVGASEEDIQRFTSLCHHVLPELYFDYLRHFGRADGGLDLNNGAPSGVDDLIEYYLEDWAYQSIPPEVIVIGREGLCGGRALLYGDNAAIDAPSVVTIWDETLGVVRAACFRNYLYCQAFLRGRFPLGLPNNLVLHARDDMLVGPFSDLAERLGFQPYWFSDPYQQCRERDSAYMHVCIYEDGTALYLNCSRQDTVREVKQAYQTQFELFDVTAR